jgi:signal transduction histidine kinase
MVQTDKTLRLICLQPSEIDCAEISRELEKHFSQVSVKRMTSARGLKEELKSGRIDLVISDYNLPELSTLKALEIVRNFSRSMPFILVSESIGEEEVADLMKAGVEDVVVKSRLERLTPVVNRVLREHEARVKEAKAQKVANEAFAAKEQMLAIVSHDIKNPLSAIQLEAQMLLRAADRAGKSVLGEEVKIQANRILKTTDRLKTLISDLLDKNKSENGLTHLCKNSVNASLLFQEALDNMRPLIQEKEIMVSSVFQKEASLQLDKNKMYQVISNLLSNAIKFTPPGGTIELGLEENSHEYVFSVADSGPGLEQRDLSKVFEKYWTGGSTPGTGLGLFICKTIVEAHSGQIAVENIPQGGAKFWFTIPKPSAEIVSPVAFDRRKDSKKRIYIIDDDEDLREVISWALGKEGFAVHSFGSPLEALSMLKREHQMPHLIVVDYHMDEMKGSEFLLKKHEIHPARACPVVMISASPLEVEQSVPQELYKEVITKPIDLESLVTNVRRFLS